MAKILLIPGSFRKGSVNLALARAAAEVAPKDCEVEVATIQGVPLYDGDVEAAQGAPPAVAALKEKIAVSDGVILVSPEYNNSVPGTLKNAIDWLSRPAKDISRVFGERAFGLMGATPGPGGTRLSQAAWLPVFRVLGARLWAGKSLFVAGADKVFDAEGRLVDEKIRHVLTGYMEGFASFAAERGR